MNTQHFVVSRLSSLELDNEQHNKIAVPFCTSVTGSNLNQTKALIKTSTGKNVLAKLMMIEDGTNFHSLKNLGGIPVHQKIKIKALLTLVGINPIFVNVNLKKSDIVVTPRIPKDISKSSLTKEIRSLPKI